MATEVKRARYGAEAHKDERGQLPNPFPRTVGPNAGKYLQEVVESGFTCNMMGRFEQAFAEAYGVRHCIATPGCTPALAVLAAAFPFEPGDEIIVSPITDYGTVQGLISQSFIPVFADAEPGTVNLSARTIEACLSARTRGILVVHKTGLVCDMDPINELAARRGIVVYEDACQAVFSQYKGRLAGALSMAGAFSFDAEKTMGSDVGGCIVTDNGELAEACRFVGQSRGGEMVPHFGRVHTRLGYAYRMTLSTAAISLAQLEIIRPQVAHRDRMIRRLCAALARIPGIAPLPIPEYQDVYSCWMAGLSIDPEAFTCDAEEFASQLAAAGIPGAGTGRYYLMPAALPFLTQRAAEGIYPYSRPPASYTYEYSPDTCPAARAFLDTFIRWSSFCEKYTEADCDLAAAIVAEVADQNRA
ncbi:MAG: DegT/DnrJ/EryC1/StrS family aminotransferase [Gemmatimonadota bacterium]